ncbi:unnamed protein product [Linum tenue]|uniref:Uncharacterized protein n=1 Tax=Linum tenue TaxID=586396 RepID=A0AAV0KHN0_9ROSI|nr:unnamed protein product [Linum tenue]
MRVSSTLAATERQVTVGSWGRIPIQSTTSSSTLRFGPDSSSLYNGSPLLYNRKQSKNLVVLHHLVRCQVVVLWKDERIRVALLPNLKAQRETKVAQSDAMPKCDIWMLSRARNLMEDQLLEFAVVRFPEITSADGGLISPAGSVHPSAGFLSSTTTSFSDDRNSSDSKDKKGGNGGGGGRSSSSAYLNVSIPGEGNQRSSSSVGYPDTPTSRKRSEIRDLMPDYLSPYSLSRFSSSFGRKIEKPTPPPRSRNRLLPRFSLSILLVLAAGRRAAAGDLEFDELLETWSAGRGGGAAAAWLLRRGVEVESAGRRGGGADDGGGEGLFSVMGRGEGGSGAASVEFDCEGGVGRRRAGGGDDGGGEGLFWVLCDGKARRGM